MKFVNKNDKFDCMEKRKPQWKCFQTTLEISRPPSYVIVPTDLFDRRKKDNVPAGMN